MNCLITSRMIEREFVYQQMFREGPWEAKRCVFDHQKVEGRIGNQTFPLSELALSLDEFSLNRGWMRQKPNHWPFPFHVQ